MTGTNFVFFLMCLLATIGLLKGSKTVDDVTVWEGAGQEVGLESWRIENFDVKPVDDDELGEFYIRDSYIFLNTYRDEEIGALCYDFHSWVGNRSSRVERIVAVYNMMKLRVFLDDAPVPHKEVQGYESALFKSYFPSGISYYA